MTVKRSFAVISLLFTPLSVLFAQEEWEETADSTEVVELIDSITGGLPNAFDLTTQDLLEGWHVKHFTKPEEFCEDEDRNPSFTEQEYRERLERLPFLIPVTYNETVRRCIDLYAVKLRRKMRYVMGMADFYFPMFEQKLDAYGLPVELKYLAVVESALVPTALSRVGASGLWQFMLPTGKVYGLEINSLIDERLDPEKATDAACRMFNELYKRYGDWLLVLAAYNCGPGNVNKAIKRSGGSTDFWQIFRFLPRETRSYVPLYIAAAYIMTYHCDHNICPVRADFSVATDTLVINYNLHFDQVAEALGMDKEAVRFYNPQYKREIIPGAVMPSVLRLPLDKTFAYMDREDSVAMLRAEELLGGCVPVDIYNPDSRKEKITHTVKSGETVYTIANKYGVTAAEVRKWNGFSGKRPAAGRKLKIYIDNGGLKYTPQATAATTTASATTVNSTTAKATTATAVAAAYTAKTPAVYLVKSGDSLYSISRKYPGLTIKQLQEANGLKTNKLQVGQKLIIPLG